MSVKNLLGNSNSLRIRRCVLILLDLALLYIAVELAVVLRYDGAISPSMRMKLDQRIPLLMLFYTGALMVGGVYHMMWRYAGARELFRLMFLCAAATGAVLICNRVFAWKMPRSLFSLIGIFDFLLVGGSRFGWKICREAYFARRSDPEHNRVLIVGAGEGGAYAARACQEGRHLSGAPVAFVDDNPEKRGLRVCGIPVLGEVEDIPDLVEKKGISEIIIAIPRIKGNRLNEIVSVCKSTKCRVRILADPGGIKERPVDGRQAFREVNTSDFLSRDEVTLDMDSIRGYLTGKVVLVTGGGGSIGSEICRQVMRFGPKLLIIFDVYENCAYELECELKQNYGPDCPILVRIGTICDKGGLDAIFEEYKPTIVFHAAAHKHVPLMEESCAEAVKNNVFGTLNLLASASEHGVQRLVQLSTDKAVNPTNVMGATKRVTEMLIQSFARNTKMQCVAVRFGNVLGSHGSVIPLFESQIKNGGPLTLTHPDITRYFMTIPEAAQLVLQAGALAKSGAIYVLDMGEPVRIKDLAEKLIRFYGYTPGVDMQIKITGLRPGEKLYEELLMDKERDGMTSTAHHKIFVAPPIVVDDEVFSAQLDALREAALRGGNAEVVDKLHEIVETYTPDESARQAG
ncbi:MAG TPA: polysaccharide biosynthesis protein [Candidatus Pullichristensenella excrementipullorum]|nr:polysaccharide biosynthesis protein [Candidatus Pullichristensenella excrementipullorum]